MIHSQMVIRYRPKYANIINQWYTDYNELQSYISYQSEDSTQATTDAAQIPFLQKNFFTGNIDNFSTATITCNAANWIVNAWRFFTVLDGLNNRYKILSNTSNTITLIPDSEFTWVSKSGPTINTSFKIQLPMFEIGDEMDIYAWRVTDATFTTLDETNLVFVGQIKGINDRYGDGGIQSIITLENITEVLFKSFNNPKLTTASGNCMEKIQLYIVDMVNQNNQGMINIAWNAQNPTVKKDLVTPFPDIDYFTDYKSNYECIAELLTNRYTQDGEYYFYIKPTLNTGTGQPQYELVIRAKNFSVSAELVEGIDFKLVSRTKDKGDVVTFLIIRCGRDMYGANITTYVWGDLKWGYLGKPIAVNFAGDIMDYEISRDKAVSGSNFNTTDPAKMPVPLKTSGSYTTYYSVTAQEAAIYPTHLTAGTLTTSSGSTYQNWVRWLARARAKIVGSQYLLQNNQIKNKVTVEFYNAPISAIPGNIYNMTLNSIGWTDAGLGGFDYRKRLRNINKSINVTDKGVVTQITYEEDWEMINNG